MIQRFLLYLGLSFLLLTAFTTTGNSTTLFAEDNDEEGQPPSRYGIKVGTNIANISGEFAEQTAPETQIGAVIGAFIAAPLTEHITLRPEILYIQKGYSGELVSVVRDGDDEVVDVLRRDGTLRMDYIEAYIPFVVDVLSEQTLTPQFFVGPFFGRKLNAEHDYEDAEPQDITDEARELDFGFTIGTGGFISFNGNGITFDARYNLSFANIFDDEDIEEEIEAYHQGIVLTIGYKF